MMDNVITAVNFATDNWHVILPIVVSLLSLIISYISYNRSRIFQDYEYSVRLQLTDDVKTASSRIEIPDGIFSYKGKLENKGLKPVEIIRIDFGSGMLFDLSRCEVKTHTGRRYLTPGENINVDFSISNKEMLAIEDKYSINQCTVFIIIKYKDIRGVESEKKLLVGGFGEGNIGIFVLKQGDTIT